MDEKTKARIRLFFGTPAKYFYMLYCKSIGVKIAKDFTFHGMPKLYLYDSGSITIGTEFLAVSSWRKNSIGVIQPVVLKTMNAGAKISIGNNVGISGSTLSAKVCIEVGNDVMIGSGCIITDSDAHPITHKGRVENLEPDTAKVTIGNGAFIGARTIILKGVSIGEGSVIGAGSVVSKDVPAGVIAAGNPIRVLKELSSE